MTAVILFSDMKIFQICSGHVISPAAFITPEWLENGPITGLILRTPEHDIGHSCWPQ